MTAGAAIPAWNAAGVLPPVHPSASGNSSDRSPYLIDLFSLVDRFSTSPERRAILDGLLRYRAALHQVGIVSGFQWLDGSFTENVEILDNRPPRDMDIVTFADLNGINQQLLIENHKELFDTGCAKEKFTMDSYFVQLGGSLSSESIRRVAYWYSMWSHRRNGLWKGFLQVDLGPSQDAKARELLSFHGGPTHE